MQLKKRILLGALAFLLFNCHENTFDSNLESGLENYRKVRHINESFLPGYSVKKLAFFKSDSIHYKFVLQLNNDAIEDVITNYSLGMVVFTDKKYLPENKEYLIWGMQPTIESYGEYKYIVKNVETPIIHIDSLHIFLYDLDEYKGVKGDMIRLKNIEL